MNKPTTELTEDYAEGNKLIAVFDGVTWEDTSKINYPAPNKQWLIKFPKGQEFEKYGNIDEIISKMTKYHTSWDWFMPAYKKFRSLTGMKMPDWLILCNTIENRIVRVNIKEAHYNLCEAIKWYNNT